LWENVIDCESVKLYSRHMLTTNLDELLTVAEVAELCRVHANTVYKWANKGEYGAQRYGNKWRFRRGDLPHWNQEKDEDQ
jgi:excisionase family DNA binding protein